MRRNRVENVIARLVLAFSVAFSSLAVGPTTACAQEEASPKRSLASRIASLRLGWKEETPAAEKQTSSRPPSPVAAGTAKSGESSSRSRLPRLNPRDLLPGELFSGKPSTRSQAATKPTKRRRVTAQPSAAATGSARTRMFRDMRNRAPNASQNKSAIDKQQASTSAKAATRVASRAPLVATDSASDQTKSPTVLPRLRSTRAGSVLSEPSDGGFAFSSGPSDSSRDASPGVTPSSEKNYSPLTAQPTETLDAAELRRELLRFTPNGAVQKKVVSREPSTRLPEAQASAQRMPSLTGAEQTTKSGQAAKAALAKSVAADVAKEFASTENAPQASKPDVSEPAKEAAAIAATKASVDEGKESAAKATPMLTSPKPANRYANESNDRQESNRYGDRYSNPYSDSFSAASEASAAMPKNISKSPVAEKDIAETLVPVIRKPNPKTLVVKSAESKSPRRLQMDLSANAESSPVAPLSVSTASQQGLRSSFSDRGSSYNASSRGASTPKVVAQEDPNDLLLTQKMPLIASRVSGPRQIVIGRKATYRVTIVNRGDASARQLVTTVDSPEWADIISTKTSNGTVDHRRTEGQLEWEIDQFAAKSTSTLDITLIARSGRPIELGVNWKHAPVSSSTLVEVQEPKLNIEVSGPDDVLFGKPQLYRLTLSNPGTGVAEGVVVQLLPPGKSPAEATSHSMGDLAAGESRSVELELTAREAGQLKLQASATAKGDISAETLKELFCRKPALDVDWRGPEQKYAGAAATYYFRVRNPGTAIAEAVSFVIDLPEGFKLSAASDGQYYDAAKRQVSWKVGSLRPGDDFYMELKGTPLQAGPNHFRFTSATSDQLATAKSIATTEVVALADLKLEVRDPKGPIPVGTEAIYEVRVRNRGANTAKQINVTALFSAGIEPQSVEGAECTIADGRVALRTIDRLEAGREVLVKIRARALQPGTHIFRTEVDCADLDIKLSADETTRFYADEPIDLGGAGSPRSASDADRFVYPR